MSSAGTGMSVCAQRSASVGGSVDAQQLIVITLVGTCIGRRSIGIAGVIHTGPKVRIVEIRVMVVESKGMSDLLAGHQRTPRRGVILRSDAEVGVIELHRALGDVVTCR